MPLSVIREGRRPGSRWLPTDRTLAVALTVHVDGICSGCGQPVGDSWGDNARAYEVKVKVCAGCASLERHRDQEAKPRPGSKPYVVQAEGEIGQTKFPPRFA